MGDTCRRPDRVHVALHYLDDAIAALRLDERLHIEAVDMDILVLESVRHLFASDDEERATLRAG